MTSDDIITGWKDEGRRRADASEGLAQVPPNPAGLSPFDRRELDVAGGAAPSTILLGSAWLSCMFACAETMWDGSCDLFTYGCC